MFDGRKHSFRSRQLRAAKELILFRKLSGYTYLEDLVHLIEVRLPRHERLAKQQLAQDAPRRPQVDGGGVRVAPEEQLRAPVPEGDHLADKENIWVTRACISAKVSNRGSKKNQTSDAVRCSLCMKKPGDMREGHQQYTQVCTCAACCFTIQKRQHIASMTAQEENTHRKKN